ncbi:MAG: flagellar hook-associated protein FlgK [Alphaproteobacteria bacterium]|nr:MAG: flagellar hook-associated protein FlgK [Alphaproteobacteria bacterium]
MSLNNILSASLSGLFANQEAIRVTSNNVANVNTENYARMRVTTEANVLQGQSVGVSVSAVQRVVDTYLETALRTANANTSEYSAEREFHDRLQGILGDPASDSSLSARIDQVFQSMGDLALNPADVLRRQQMLSELSSFTDQMNLFQEEIQNLRSDASAQISETVTAVNEELQRIYELNPLLVRQASVGGETGGLENQLADALANLSQYIDINVNRNSDGSVSVTTGSGYALVDNTLSQLSYDAPGVVAADTVFSNITISRVNPDTMAATSTAKDLTPNIRSGKLAGLLEMRDGQLTDLALSLGELAANVMDQFNAVQNKFSAVPAPNSMTGNATIVDGAQAPNFTGIVTFAVVNGSNEVVATTTVDFDSAPPATFNDLITQVNTGLGGAGTLSLTNGVMSLNATSSSNGVVIADDPDNPSQRAGRGFSHFFGMNNLIEASQPGIYETGLTGSEAHNMVSTESMSFKVTSANGRELATITVPVTGTTYNDMVTQLNSVSGLGAYFNFALDANGELGWTTNSGYAGATLEVVSDTTLIGSSGLSFTQAFGIGDAFHVNASRDISIRSDIVSDPNMLSLAVFDQSAAVGDVALTDGDQRGALAFQDLETGLVNFSEAGELKAGSLTLTQYVARFLGNAGLQAQRAQNLEEDNLALQYEIAQRNSDVSGVNMDEELANLIVYQNAYGAAARILSSVQELYDTLLNAV